MLVYQTMDSYQDCNVTQLNLIIIEIVQAFISLKIEDLSNGMKVGQSEIYSYGQQSLMIILFRNMFLRSSHLKAMEVAKKAGALLSHDPNMRLPLWPSLEEAHKQIMSIWDKAEVIKVSDNELEFLTRSDKIDDETAMFLWHPNYKASLGILKSSLITSFFNICYNIDQFFGILLHSLLVSAFYAISALSAVSTFSTVSAFSAVLAFSAVSAFSAVPRCIILFQL
nr:fructokinase-2 [Tanacetum cinerariifolium]